MIPGERFKIEYFDVFLADFKCRILNRTHGNYSKSYESYKRFHNTEALFRLALAGKNQPNILDIGCGDGYHICVFNRIQGVAEKARICGLDRSRLRIEFAVRVSRELSFSNIHWMVGSAESLPFSDGHFDIVLCSDVVEHLTQPDQCFAEMFRACSPGGVVIVTTPNATTPIPRIVHGLKRGSKGCENDPHGHISLKGVAEWKTIAQKAGFTVGKVKRGALLFGGERVNRYPAVFALTVLVDRLFDLIPLSYNIGEAVTFELRK